MPQLFDIHKHVHREWQTHMRMVPAVTCDPFKMADMAAARNQKEKNETREEHVGKTYKSGAEETRPAMDD